MPEPKPATARDRWLAGLDQLERALLSRMHAEPADRRADDAAVDALLAELKPLAKPGQWEHVEAAVACARMTRWGRSFNPEEGVLRTLKRQLYVAKRLHLVLSDFTIDSAADPRVAQALREFKRCMPPTITEDVEAAIRAEDPQKALDHLEALMPALKRRIPSEPPPVSDAGAGAPPAAGTRKRKRPSRAERVASQYAEGVRLAAERGVRLPTGRGGTEPTDKAVYDFLAEHGNFSPDELGSCESWIRAAQEYRRITLTHKHTRRSGRAARSIARLRDM